MKIIRILFCVISLSIINPAYPRILQQRAATPNQPAVIVPQQQLQNPNINARTPQQPAVMAQQQLQNQNIKINYGMATAQNKRDYQEDRFDQRKIIAINNGDFFAIYDGHGGDQASSFLQKNLATYFTESLLRRHSIQDAFGRALFRIELQVLFQFDDGSTVIAAFVDEKNIVHFAWLGDSRAVLEKNGSVDFATQDHKPDNKNELDRIRKAGGTIEKHGVWRINGLAISRSIGDRRLKEKGEGQIIAKPEYATVQLDSNNHFLILASDGLWDVIESQEAIDMVKNQLSTRSNLNAIALYLQNEAIARGSQDNITICVVTFGELMPATPLRNASPAKRRTPVKKQARARNPKRTPNKNRARK